MGLALQEALWHGCACVASRTGAIPELIEHGANGLLVRAGNVSELSTALEQLMSNETLRRELALRAPKAILEKGINAEQMLREYRQLYDSILGG